RSKDSAGSSAALSKNCQPGILEDVPGSQRRFGCYGLTGSREPSLHSNAVIAVSNRLIGPGQHLAVTYHPVRRRYQQSLHPFKVDTVHTRGTFIKFAGSPKTKRARTTRAPARHPISSRSTTCPPFPDT